ncbi:EFR1 family ferrodoxin [Colibacter massiliensis]|uniref:EFR1 family ferrodoxin n=1 Tax=Colibacter massiliensis TaxID=1852379 RepID=UPI002352CEC3|nr:EFR1 family ferrodoxin [Colibacter massiliensis]
MWPVKIIKAVWFSPTGTTQKTVTKIAATLSKELSLPIETCDFTLPEKRTAPLVFSPEELIVFGMPVYAGRVPNVIIKYIRTVSGPGALAVPVVLYGNRNYDDALIELRDALEGGGMHTIAAAAFIGEHSFSRSLAKGRPDKEDLARAACFAASIAEKIRSGNTPNPIHVRGESPYRPYYTPRLKDGTPIDIRKVTSKITDACTYCGICAALCPMGSLDAADPEHYINICIKCGACIKGCPRQARYYDDAGYLFHKRDLEEVYSRRAEPEIFL